MKSPLLSSKPDLRLPFPILLLGIGISAFTFVYLFVENEPLKYLALCLIVIPGLVSAKVAHQSQDREAEGHTQNKGYMGVILLLYSAILAMILLVGLIY